MERKSRSTKDYDYFIRAVLVGNSAVGKSSLMLRFSDDDFKESYTNTIGVDFRFRTIMVDGARVKIQIWDTAGQEKFRTLNSTYYRGSDAVIMVYDITNERSFREIGEYWVPEIKNYVDDISTFMIIGNKCDLVDQRAVDQRAAELLKVGDSPIIFFETSAKDSYNVLSSFEGLARSFIQRKRDKRRAKRDMNNNTLESLGTSTFNIKEAGGQVDEEDEADIYNLHMQLSSNKQEKKKFSECSC